MIEERKNMFAVSILRKSATEKETLSHAGTRVFEPEPQGLHLNFVLMDQVLHDRLMGKCPRGVGEKGQRFSSEKYE